MALQLHYQDSLSDGEEVFEIPVVTKTQVQEHWRYL